MSAPRPGNGWATADDWAAHRPFITSLYRDQNKTLKETMQVMQDKHDFFATVRMYKARFQQWGIEKKIKAEDAVEIFRQQTARAKAGKSSVAYVRGRRINPDRLQRYRYRAAAVVSEQILLVERESSESSPEAQPVQTSSHIICRTPSPGPCDTPSISPRLEDPPDLKVPQECMQILGNYIAGSFEAGVWQQTDPDKAEVNDAFTWAHFLATSQGLIAHNRTKEGFFLLGICFDQYKSHLQHPDSFFWLATYKAVMLLAHRDRKLGETFINYASKLTSLMLPRDHPFNHVWSRIMITGLPGLQQHAAALFESYLDTWRHHITSINADENSIVQMAFVFIQLHCSGMITHAFLRDIIEMMMGLLSGSPIASQYLLQEAKFRMACLFLEKRKLNKAETVIEEIVFWLDSQPYVEYIHLRVKCMWALFEIKDHKGMRVEALQIGYDLIKLCQETYGMVHLQTLDAMSAVEEFLHRTGNKAVAQMMTDDFENRWAAFSDSARARKGFPHPIEKPWFHRCIEMEEDSASIQESIDLFERSSWLKDT
ncbi:Uu.00g125530.m01.CDS01 [Anthostomella pinea]|uniref:Uu.00g125530.m01.CDS01 n=1 Tax=Anthostomella pinea TaxID=933095 RepID=A0AAI8YHP6_9PEZI|nr:Uu.00g125530.m01.CDS01 [Anthostomella pinea]